MLGSTRAWGKQESKDKTLKNGAFLSWLGLPAHNHGEFRWSEHKLLSSMVENGGEGLHLSPGTLASIFCGASQVHFLPTVLLHQP